MQYSVFVYLSLLSLSRFVLSMHVQCFLCVVYLAYCFIVFIPLGLFLYVLSLYGLFFVIIFHVLCLSTASTLFLASLSSLYRIFLHVLISYSRCIVRMKADLIACIDTCV